MSLLTLDAAPGAEVVGFKAAALGRLRQAGLPVPAGVCVPVAIELAQLRRWGLDDLVGEVATTLSAGQGWRRPAALLRARLAEAELGPELVSALRACCAAEAEGARSFTRPPRTGSAAGAEPTVVPPPPRGGEDARLTPAPRGGEAALVTRLWSARATVPAGRHSLAVRSSALVEGSLGASLAGLFASFLGVRGLDELIPAVQACWSSRWADHVLVYADARGLAVDRLAMGVLIQVAVPAVAAGGADSADADSLIVNGVWGLGRALAQAEIVPDLWRLDRASLAVREHRPGVQTLMATLDANGGEEWQPVPAPQAGRACLDDATLLRLGALVRDVEAVLGGPQSIEWALDPDGALWLVQARPLVVTPPGAHGHATAPGSETVAARLDGGGLRDGARLLVGQPAAGGQVIGRAHLLHSLNDLARLGPDAVVVAAHLRPGTTVSLPRVAGLVLEAGGTTSHAASLARERGIPAVFGARGATRLIPPGAAVLVDGSAGRVWYQP